MSAVTPQELAFDIAQVLPMLAELTAQDAVFAETDQFALRYRSSREQLSPRELFYDGNGSLFDFKQNVWLAHEKDFDRNHPQIRGTYLEEILERLSVRQSGRIGRARFLRLRPKSCYSWHFDPDETRLHVPLITNPACFYLTEEFGIERMSEPGRLYQVRTNTFHTAVNASFQERIHLVVSTY